MLFIASLAITLVPHRPFAPSEASCHSSLSRRAAIGAATTALFAAPHASLALESKKPPDVKAIVAELDRTTPKSERNSVPAPPPPPPPAPEPLEASESSSSEETPPPPPPVPVAKVEPPRSEADLKDEFFPKISFEGAQGQGKKIVFTVKHENLAPPSFSAIEYMWIKDESSGAILTAKKFRPSDPNLLITAFGSPGQKLTAASKDDKYGIWQGTFVVP